MTLSNPHGNSYRPSLSFVFTIYGRLSKASQEHKPCENSRSGIGRSDRGDPIASDPTLHGLREISSLASWTVSTHKPHCGALSLLHPSPNTFWQSDGPQPHLLTAHFPKTITILKLRVFLDFALDESYTPTRIEFYGGVHGADYGLVQFAEWKDEEPRGWQDISVEGCGPGGGDGVRARVVQLRVMENHQNGKDTHMRGVQVFARDEKVKRAALPSFDHALQAPAIARRGGGLVNGFTSTQGGIRSTTEGGYGPTETGLEENGAFETGYIGEEPDWMGEPELR